jgi:hypothetical protein
MQHSIPIFGYKTIILVYKLIINRYANMGLDIPLRYSFYCFQCFFVGVECC